MSKAGEPGSFAAYLFNGATALSYADAAAFSADGWTLKYLLGGAVAVLGTFTCAAIAGDPGLHAFTFTHQAGEETITIVPPSSVHFSSPRIFAGEAETFDIDGIASLLTSSSGTPVSSARAIQTDYEITEGDSFLREITVPAAALADFGFSDLTGTWIAAASVRLPSDTSNTQPPPGGAAITCVIKDAAARIISISWPAYPAAMALSAADISSGSKAFNYDAQLRTTKLFAITAVSTGAGGTFTIAGDQRRFLRVGDALTITGSTNNNAQTKTISALALVGGNTVVTITETVGAVADGSINVAITITGARGRITVKRQEDRS